MKRYLLDTSALLTPRDDEPGAARVSEVLQQAAKGKARCYGCIMSLMEGLYRVWRDKTEASSRLAYQQCLELPLEWVRDSDAFLKAAPASEGLSDADIEALIAERREARARKDFKRSDAIRDELKAKGVVLEDSAGGTGWRRG